MAEFELKQQIVDGIDIVDLIDLLGITSEDIVERFWEEIEEKVPEIRDFLGISSLQETEE